LLPLRQVKHLNVATCAAFESEISSGIVVVAIDLHVEAHAAATGRANVFQRADLG
jgi:hypothetical protein